MSEVPLYGSSRGQTREHFLDERSLPRADGGTIPCRMAGVTSRKSHSGDFWGRRPQKWRAVLLCRINLQSPANREQLKFREQLEI